MTNPCPNCGATQLDRFCAGCGQDARPRLSFRELAGQVIGGLFNLDSRLWRTLRDLAVPGRITAEYLAGHRARYMPPVQTYLVVALLFFALVPTGFDAFAINLVARDAVEARAASAGVEPQQEVSRWIAENKMPTASVEFQRGVSLFSILMFVTMPLFALLLHAVHLGQRRDYLEHLVLAIHLQTVGFGLTAIALALEAISVRFWLPAPTLVTWPLLLLLLVVHGVLAVRRVYGEHFVSATLKVGAVGLANVTLLILAVRAVTLLTEASGA